MQSRAESLTLLIRRNADEVNRLHARIHETLEEREKSADKRLQWQQACEAFHARYDELAFPGGYLNGGTEGGADAHERILAGDAQTLEAALCFVELRPYFFRSGYMFAALLRKLKRTPLDAAQTVRLQAVLDSQIAWRNQKMAKA